MGWEKFWWQSVAGANAMVNAAASALSSGKSVTVSDFDSLPWSDTFREAVWSEYISSGGVKGVQYIEAEYITDPGEHMISLLSSSFGYRPNAQTPSSFIRSLGELRDRILWVFNIEPDTREAWYSICKDLAGEVQFVFETQGPGRPVSGAELIRFGEFVHDYDFSLFALSAACSRLDCGGLRTCRYIAELAFSHFKNDAEGILDFALKFSPDTDPCQCGLSQEAVWRAQIRTAYHIIEEARRSFIQDYNDEIQACLPQWQYGEEIDDPENAEYALLWYLSRPFHPAPRLSLSQDAEDLLKLLRDARNSLAHGKALSPGNLARLFEV